MMMQLGARRPAAARKEDREGPKDGLTMKPKFKPMKKRQAEEAGKFPELLKASMTSTFREMVATIMQPPISSSTEDIPTGPEYATINDVCRLEGRIDELAAIVIGLVSEMANNKAN